jgi:hypothetical protein
VYSILLFFPATQKEKMDWNSSTRSSKLRVTPVAVPVELWSLPLFHFIESHHSLWWHYLCNNYTLFMTCGYLWTLLGRMCGTINPGSCIRWVLGFGIKTGYDSSDTFLGMWSPAGLNIWWRVDRLGTCVTEFYTEYIVFTRICLSYVRAIMPFT